MGGAQPPLLREGLTGEKEALMGEQEGISLGSLSDPWKPSGNHSRDLYAPPMPCQPGTRLYLVVEGLKEKQPKLPETSH